MFIVNKRRVIVFYLVGFVATQVGVKKIDSLPPTFGVWYPSF